MTNQLPKDKTMPESQPAVGAPVEPSVRPFAVQLASVPIVDRGIGWQADATATLKAQAALIDDLAMMLKTCAWALRRGSSPDLGERALVLLKKHGLLGTPLRDETLDEAGAAAAALYDRWTGKA